MIHDMLESKQYTPNDVAILVRSNADADPFVRALNMKGVPWRFSGNRGLYGRGEVRLLVSFLKTVADFEDSMNLHALASSPVYEVPMEDLQKCVHVSRTSHRSLFDAFRQAGAGEGGQGLSAEGRVTLRKIVDDLERYLELSRDNVTGVVLYQFLMNSGYLKRLQSRPEDGKDQNIARF
jgi:DNA helicase-2/ATP-dependent DNA helicase PcrA